MTAVTFISTIPQFISVEEHVEQTSQTPASFSDIPPVLRHREDNVKVEFDPPLEGFSEQDAADGTLYVIESYLVYWSVGGKGFQVEYPSISLHAISRAETGPFLYCQLDEYSRETAERNEDEEPNLVEMKLLPRNVQSLETIFEALSACAALHPDEVGSDIDIGEDMDDAFLDADVEAFQPITGEDDQELTEAGRATLGRLENLLENSRRRTTINGNHESDGDNPDQRGSLSP